MAEIPAPIPTDPEDVSWALETANALWKRGDQEDALNWVQRAINTAREAGQTPRARELEVVLSFLKPKAVVDIEVDLETTQAIDDLAEIADLEEIVEAAPAAPPRAPPRPPPRPPGPPPGRPATTPPPPTAASPAPSPAVPPSPPTPTTPVPAAPPTQASDAFLDENTVTEWPPPGVSAAFSNETTEPGWPPQQTPPELASIEETVTEWPPKGMAADFLASFPIPGAPEAAAPKPAPPAPRSAPPAPQEPGTPSSAEQPSHKPRTKTLAAPAPLDLDDDWFDPSGPPTYRPPPTQNTGPSLSTLLQRNQSRSLVPSAEVLIRDSSPDLNPPASPPPQKAPPPASSPEIVGAPPTQKRSIPSELLEAAGPQSTVLDELPAFVDIPAEQRQTFFQEAKRKTLHGKEFVRGFALGVVLQGEATVTGFNSDVPVAKLTAGMTLRARGTVGKTLPLRMVAGPKGCEVVTWSEAPLQATLQACPWVDTELRSSANNTLGLVGVASGLLGSLEPHIFEQLCSWLQPRVLTPGEIALHEGETTPPLLVVGTGTIELVKNDVVERTLAPGELVLPPECAQGVRASTQARAGAEGAVVMLIDKARRQAMQTSLPAVIALLSGL